MVYARIAGVNSVGTGEKKQLKMRCTGFPTALPEQQIQVTEGVIALRVRTQ